MTYYFEIKNTKTNETFQGYGPGMRSIALQAGWKIRDCKCVYRALNNSN
jgi:hypothetical protein